MLKIQLKKQGIKKNESLIRFIDNVIVDEDKKNEDDDNEEDVWMIGFPFFKNFLVRYEFERRKVGFKEINGKIIDLNLEWKERYDDYIYNKNYGKIMKIYLLEY